MQMTGSLEDYVECIYLLILDENTARIRDIALRMGVKTPSVVKAISILKEDGIVTQAPYGSVELTSAGEREAKRILATHHLLKKFLICLGVEKETAEEDCCKMEHILSRETLGRIAQFVKSNDPSWEESSDLFPDDSEDDHAEQGRQEHPVFDFSAP